MISLGLTPDVILAPLVQALIHKQVPHSFQLVFQSPQQNCQHLLGGRLDLAFLTPWEYMHHSGQLEIYPRWAVFSESRSGYALLFFRENLQNILEVGVRVQESYYSHFARVALQEIYELTPEWKPVDAAGDLDLQLDLHGAVFLEKEAALKEAPLRENFLDLVQEWSEQFGGGFVHLILCKLRDRHIPVDQEVFNLSLNYGLRNLMKIAQEIARKHAIPWDYLFDLWQESYRFLPAVEQWNQLGELMRYFYYLGAVDYISDLHFVS